MFIFFFSFFFFLSWSNISFFPIVGKKTCNKWVLENQCKWMKYRVSTNFNRLNWNPIMTMCFTYIESFITSLLPKQIVLIRSFVIYDIFAGKILLFGISEHCFAKKELKTVTFYWKSVTNLLIINNGSMLGTFLPL